MSSEASTAPRKALFNRLPREFRDELITIGRRAKTMFGRIRFQDVFDENLSLFERLAANGATAADIGEVLAAAGVARRDGSVLPEGTVTSALSRARERAGRRATNLRPAGPCMTLPIPAPACNAPHEQENASVGGLPRRPSRQQPPAPMPGSSSVRVSPGGPAGFDLPAHTRRTAALLDQIRSENDEDD
ncbi:hypothetical protein ABIE85_005262 [Bradyrhizobium diazoefficiens]|uniref:hypothetical protein n=1 Tax=Bradyrhizobium TaxID=374 RepID=UPI001B4D974C|nr:MULTISPECIES: hypothetical protein [Bradyrhizobium]MBP1095986.1 hypothetical protein [Bradyrhizobium japonicum]MDA9538980.1 hypothetical protein [Bradyrhizobium sp. CCBAU 21362]WLA55870.1 hypothetical protein QIH81_35945 [Bradyrhizobium diazoefficiens]